MTDRSRAVIRGILWARSVAVLGTSLLLVGAMAFGGGSNPKPAPLADAAMHNDFDAVKKLIKSGAEVNAAQGDGMTALHWAAEHGDSAMADVLIHSHASVRAVTRIGSYTPLHIASKSGSAAIVRALLKAGSDANAATTSGATALHFAAAAGNVDAVTALLEAHADVNARESEWGQTPLIFAASENRAAVIKMLLAHGADASIRTKAVNLTEEQAAEQAATKRRNEVFASFKPKKDSAVKKDSIGLGRRGTSRGPKDSAVAKDSAAAKDSVAAADAAPAAGGRGAGGGGRGAPAPSTDGLTPAQIQQAIVAGRTVPATAKPTGPVTEEVVDTANGQVAGYAGTVGSMGGLTALHHAARQGNVEAVVALLDGGADINETNNTDGTTPLLMATINGQFDVALTLVKRGANVNLGSTAGATPVYTTLNTQWAPRSRFPQPQAVQVQKTTYLEVLDALLKAGADPNVRIKTHLWYFAFNNCGSGNCGLENLEGTNAFWRAAYAVDVEAMRMLVAHGAETNVPSQRTPVVAGRGGRGGGRGGRGGGRGGAAGDSAAAPPQQFARGGGGGGGGRGGDPRGPPLEPAIDSAAKAVPPGIGVYAIHRAAGVGYGNGFAGNAHRHAPDGWMPAMRYLVDELHADVNVRATRMATPRCTTPPHAATTR